MQLVNETGNESKTIELTRGIIARQTGNLRRIVDDLLDVARITRGKIELRRQSVDLAHTIGRAVESVRPFLEEKSHELHTALADAGPLRVEADAARIEQCIVNLLINAIKYTPTGGRIEITGQLTGTEAMITVRDNGIGIASEVLPHVFDLFTQADLSLDRAQGGARHRAQHLPSTNRTPWRHYLRRQRRSRPWGAVHHSPRGLE